MLARVDQTKEAHPATNGPHNPYASGGGELVVLCSSALSLSTSKNHEYDNVSREQDIYLI